MFFSHNNDGSGRYSVDAGKKCVENAAQTPAAVVGAAGFEDQNAAHEQQQQQQYVLRCTAGADADERAIGAGALDVRAVHTTGTGGCLDCVPLRVL